MRVETTQPVWSQIEAAVQDVPGWSAADQLYTLFTLAASSAHLDADVVEVGSWCGRSAVALGLAAQLTGRGTVHCIDLFPERDDWYRNDDGTYSLRVSLQGGAVNAYVGQRVWAEPFERDIRPLYAKHASVFGVFRETIAARGLAPIVKPFRGTVETFLAAAPKGFRCRLAFIDGDHGYEAVCNDVTRLSAHLVPGGWLCFDDAFSTYEGVDRAICELVVGNPAFDFAQQMTRKLFVARKATQDVRGAQ